MKNESDNILNYDCDVIVQSQRGPEKYTYIVPRNELRFQKLENISYNKNAVQQIIHDYKNKGLIKNCSKICISKGTNGGFYPDCKDSSLEWTTIEAGDRYNNLHTKKYLNSCGKSCAYFEYRLVGNIKKSCAAIKSFFNATCRIIRNFYREQPIPIKILIWLAICGVFAPNIVSTAIKMYVQIAQCKL